MSSSVHEITFLEHFMKELFKAVGQTIEKEEKAIKEEILKVVHISRLLSSLVTSYDNEVFSFVLDL